MLKRIALILQTQNLTVSQFADRIGVQRSALSHVLGGRNNPSLDFVTKILRTFPEIRSQWLLFGEGKMYDAMSEVRIGVEPTVERPMMETAMRPEPVAEVPAEILAASDAVGDIPPASGIEIPPVAASEMPVSAAGIPAEMPSETPADAPLESPLPDGLPNLADFAPVQPAESRLVKVVFFYSDGRFEEYARR